MSNFWEKFHTNMVPYVKHFLRRFALTEIKVNGLTSVKGTNRLQYRFHCQEGTHFLAVWPRKQIAHFLKFSKVGLRKVPVVYDIVNYVPVHPH